MTKKFAILRAALEKALDDRIQGLTESAGELTLVVKAADYYDVMCTLRDDASLKFEQLIDLCGADYADYDDGAWNDPRSAAVSHLLSITHNWCVHVRVFAPDDDLLVVASVTTIWSPADWYERETFDLYGLVFESHPDLRRILTDYGFVDHPSREDLPVSGYVEIRYDPVQRHVVYQSVTIEPREITSRVIREDQYGDLKHRRASDHGRYQELHPEPRFATPGRTRRVTPRAGVR